ncbi:Pre-rRNA-processing protein rix1 [Favolaschia claudopus]|uniref:Pre-rRNA-processing protein RIX1 n=1 Tax=Favolaschia claudopus TaxID=2862362 RepID=A0AAW0E9A7_9AGAR
MDGHPLKSLLQLQLGSDSYAVTHLPHILNALTAESLLPSAHSSKWIARVNSLLHSKAPDAKWAGLCLAHRTSVLSKFTMIECAQSWLGIALPILSKNEAPPILSASVRLLRVIFSSATDVPEFQRQVATPNILKFTAALIPLAEKHADNDLKILILSTLAVVIPLYPTIHRTSHAALSTLCFSFLNGHPFKPPNIPLSAAASRLYRVLHFTGGKVGAANLWKKSVDDTLVFGWNAFLSIRPGYRIEGQVPQLPVSTEEPLISIPLNADRLRCSVLVLCDLLKATTHRPVEVPLGRLTKFAIALLSCTPDDKVDSHIDPGVRAMQTAVIPQLWKLACDLISCLTSCVGQHLSSSLSRIVTSIVFHLEQNLTGSQRLPFLNTLQVVLEKCHPLHATHIVNRLGRAIVPFLSIVLTKEPESRESEGDAPGRSKKSRKRAREFEGDEVFKIGREVVCPSAVDGEVLLSAFAVLRIVLRNPNLSSAMQSLSCRVVLSVLLALPQISPESLSPDLKLHPLLLERVQAVSVELGAGSTGNMGSSLGLVVGANLKDCHMHRDLEVLLHPRLPPLLRSMPAVEALSLFRSEESQEEVELRKTLGLGSAADGDVVMDELPPPPPAAAAETSKLPSQVLQEKPTIVTPSVTPAIAPPSQPLRPLIPEMVTVPDQPRIEAVAPTKPVAQPPVAVEMPVFVEEEEVNEEMPGIDLDSDSDSDS